MPLKILIDREYSSQDSKDTYTSYTSSDSDDTLLSTRNTPVPLLSSRTAQASKPPQPLSVTHWSTPPPSPPKLPNHRDLRTSLPTKARHAYFEPIDDSEDENGGSSQRRNETSSVFSSWPSIQQNSPRDKNKQREHSPATMPHLTHPSESSLERTSSYPQNETASDTESDDTVQRSFGRSNSRRTRLNVRFEVPDHDRISPHDQEVERTLERVHTLLEQVEMQTNQATTQTESIQRNENTQSDIKDALEMFFERAKKEEAEKAERLARENQMVVEEARKLQAVQAAEEAAARAEEENLKNKIKQCITDLLGPQFLENSPQNEFQIQEKIVYTRLPKDLVCKEAMEESGMEYNEQNECFLVHQRLDNVAQQRLLEHTKRMRDLNLQIEATANYAPAVAGPGGLLYKHVPVAGFPYPFVIPVAENPQAWDDQRSTPSYSTTLSEFSDMSADTLSEASNASVDIIPSEAGNHIDQMREPSMGCNDPVFRALWVQSHLLTPIVEGTQIIPKAFGMKPALTRMNLEYSETKFDFILHKPLNTEQLNEIASESFGKISTVVPKLLICEAALDEMQLAYTELPIDFLVHKELQHNTMTDLISRTKNIGSYMKLSKDVFANPILQRYLRQEGVEYTETDDSYIIHRYLTSTFAKRLIKASMKSSGCRLSFIAPKIATSSVMSHIRLATCEFAGAAMGPSEFLALPTWLEPVRLLGSKIFDTTFDAASHLARSVQVLPVEDEHLDLTDYIDLAKRAEDDYLRSIKSGDGNSDGISTHLEDFCNSQKTELAIPNIPISKEKPISQQNHSKSLVHTNKKKGLAKLKKVSQTAKTQPNQGQNASNFPMPPRAPSPPPERRRKRKVPKVKGKDKHAPSRSFEDNQAIQHKEEVSGGWLPLSPKFPSMGSGGRKHPLKTRKKMTKAPLGRPPSRAAVGLEDPMFATQILASLPSQVANEQTIGIVSAAESESNLTVSRGVEEVVIVDAIYSSQGLQEFPFPTSAPLGLLSETPNLPDLPLPPPSLVSPIPDLAELQSRISSLNTVPASSTMQMSGAQSVSAAISAEEKSEEVKQVLDKTKGRGLDTSQKSSTPTATEARSCVNEETTEKKSPTPCPSHLDNQNSNSKGSNSRASHAKQERASHGTAFSQTQLDQLKESLREAKRVQDEVIRQLRQEKIRRASKEERLQEKVRRLANERDMLHSKAESLEMEKQRILQMHELQKRAELTNVRESNLLSYANYVHDDPRHNAHGRSISLTPRRHIPRRQAPPRVQSTEAPTRPIDAGDEDGAPSREIPRANNSAVTTARAVNQPPGLRKRGTVTNHYMTVVPEGPEPSAVSDEETDKEQAKGYRMPWDFSSRKRQLAIEDSASNDPVSEEKAVVTERAHVSINLPLEKDRAKTAHEGDRSDLLSGHHISRHQLPLSYPLYVPSGTSVSKHINSHGAGLDERMEPVSAWTSTDRDGQEYRSSRNHRLPHDRTRRLIEHAPRQRESSKASDRRQRSRSSGRGHHGNQDLGGKHGHNSSERRSRSTHSTHDIEPEQITITEVIPHDRRLENGPSSQPLSVVRYQSPACSLSSHASNIVDVYRLSPFKDQHRTRKVTSGTFFVSMLLAINPAKRNSEYQIFRIELDRSEVDDKIFFQKLKSTYHGIRGWRRRLSFKGVTDIKFAQYNQDGLPQYHSHQYPTLGIEPQFRRLTVTPLSRPIDYEDFAGYSHLFHYFYNPRKVKAGSKKWVGAVNRLRGSQPVMKRNRYGQLSESIYAPPLDEPSGQGLIFTEGWVVDRIIAIVVFIVLASLVIAVVWSICRTVEQGIAAGSYVLAASSGLVGMVSLVSALDDIG
ncbi:hypothetical protein BDD12DRAFT_880405 [Trichophaea hybrida]|nr:hypothetical protein BDD12DRAFT_880405 [Trichophaea hybrida]